MVILLVSISYGVYILALGEVFAGIISSFINAYPNKNLLQYSYIEQLKDIVPSFLLASVMGGIIYTFIFLGLSPLITILLQIVFGILIYFSLAKILKFESYIYLKNTIVSLVKK